MKDMRNSLDNFSIFVCRFYGNVYFLQDVKIANGQVLHNMSEAEVLGYGMGMLVINMTTLIEDVEN